MDLASGTDYYECYCNVRRQSGTSTVLAVNFVTMFCGALL